MKPSESCVICLEAFTEEDQRTPSLLSQCDTCQHWCHRRCADAWLKISATCPMCRATVTALPDIPCDWIVERLNTVGGTNACERFRVYDVSPPRTPAAISMHTLHLHHLDELALHSPCEVLHLDVKGVMYLAFPFTTELRPCVLARHFSFLMPPLTLSLVKAKLGEWYVVNFSAVLEMTEYSLDSEILF